MVGLNDLGKITLNGLLLHDPDDRENRRLFTFTGWDETSEPETMIVPNGSGHGARGVGTWVNKEKFPTVAGRAATTDRASYLAFRKELLAALPIDREVPLVVEEPGGTLQMFVRRYGAVEPSWKNQRWTDFLCQMFAEDPFKYGLTPKGGSVGVWTGDQWFRRYADTGGSVPYFRRYDGTLLPVPNGDFEDSDLSDWIAANCADTHETTVVHGGSGAVKLACDGTGNASYTVNDLDLLPVVPGQVCVGRGWFRAATATRSVRMVFDWRDSGGGFISTSGGTAVTNSTSEYTEAVVSDHAPATAAFVRLRFQVLSPGVEDHYIDDGSIATAPWLRRYQQAEQSGDLPDSLAITSEGDMVSDRTRVEVTGPVTKGDWLLINETTGELMWADTGLVAGQTLVFDSHENTLTLQGTPVPSLFRGDWLTLPPGQSVFRLTSGTASAGFANITAFEATE